MGSLQTARSVINQDAILSYGRNRLSALQFRLL